MLIESPIKRVIQLAPDITSIHIGAANITALGIAALSVALADCKKKVAVFGMFADMAVLTEAKENKWVTYFHPGMHAKFFILKLRKGPYKVIMGSSNIGFSKNLEIDIEMSFNKVPKDIKSFLSDAMVNRVW